jgi:hypothetical protein
VKYNVDTEPSSIKSYVLFSYPNGGVKEPLLGIISISFALLLAGLITFILYVLATPFSAVTTIAKLLFPGSSDFFPRPFTDAPSLIVPSNVMLFKSSVTSTV